MGNVANLNERFCERWDSFANRIFILKSALLFVAPVAILLLEIDGRMKLPGNLIIKAVSAGSVCGLMVFTSLVAVARLKCPRCQKQAYPLSENMPFSIKGACDSCGLERLRLENGSQYESRASGSLIMLAVLLLFSIFLSIVSLGASGH